MLNGSNKFSRITLPENARIPVRTIRSNAHIMLFFIPEPTAAIHSFARRMTIILQKSQADKSRTIDLRRERQDKQEESKRRTAHNNQCSYEWRRELCWYEERAYSRRNDIAEIKKERVHARKIIIATTMRIRFSHSKRPPYTVNRLIRRFSKSILPIFWSAAIWIYRTSAGSIPKSFAEAVSIATYP